MINQLTTDRMDPPAASHSQGTVTQLQCH